MYRVRPHFPNKRRSMQRGKVIVSSPIAHLMMEGGHPSLSPHFSDMSVARIGMSRLLISTTLFKRCKQSGMKFTKDAIGMAGRR